MNKKRIGVYGGTFSPPHSGHVAAAKSFAERMAIDELLIIPDHTPPHKQFVGTTTAEERLEMCRIAFASIPGAVISDMEILRGGKSFTYETLEALSGEDRELYFLCGTDMFLTIDSWRYPERIFAAATVVCVRRENDPVSYDAIRKKQRELSERFGAKTTFLDVPVTEISSSELRAHLLSREDPGALLPPGVYDYIIKKDLYR